MLDPISERLKNLESQRRELHKRRTEIELALIENERRLERLTQRGEVRHQAEQMERTNRDFPLITPIELDENREL